MDLYTRFISKVQKTDSCWIWTAYKNNYGYGTFSYNQNVELAHRISYILHIDKIYEGLHVLHKCDNPSCVNPEHLFLGTNQDNIDDKVRKRRQAHIHKTHCPQGHPYSGDNLWISKIGGRTCLACASERSNKHRLSTPEKNLIRNAKCREYHAKNRVKILERKRIYEKERWAKYKLTKQKESISSLKEGPHHISGDEHPQKEDPKGQASF